MIFYGMTKEQFDEFVFNHMPPDSTPQQFIAALYGAAAVSHGRWQSRRSASDPDYSPEQDPPAIDPVVLWDFLKRPGRERVMRMTLMDRLAARAKLGPYRSGLWAKAAENYLKAEGRDRAEAPSRPNLVLSGGVAADEGITPEEDAMYMQLMAEGDFEEDPRW